MAYAGLVSLNDRRAHREERVVVDADGERPGGRGRRDLRIRTLVVDDDPHARGSVAAALDGVDDLDVVAVAGAEALPAYAGDHQVVVVGHRVPGTTTVALCTRVAGLDGGPGVVVVAAWARPALLRRVLQAGARGFVDSESAPEVLAAAVRAVASGLPYVDPGLSRLVVELVVGGTEPRPYGLTRAEYDVVTLLPRGLMNREIAMELGITENTVKTHLRHALRKLAVRDRAQAAALVVREGLA